VRFRQIYDEKGRGKSQEVQVTHTSHRSLLHLEGPSLAQGPWEPRISRLKSQWYYIEDCENTGSYVGLLHGRVDVVGGKLHGLLLELRLLGLGSWGSHFEIWTRYLKNGMELR